MSASDSKLKSRRKHKNSKNGCPNCKKRRVKCSEDLPSCLNCLKHKVKCGYLDYTEAQIQELTMIKLANAEDSDDSSKKKGDSPKNNFKAELLSPENPDVNVINKNYPSPPRPQTNWSNTSIGNSSHNPSLTSFQQGSSISSVATFPPPSVSMTSAMPPPAPPILSSLSFNSLISGVNNAMSIDQKEISQDFDNLLTTTNDPEDSIIYPVYSLIGDPINEGSLEYSSPWVNSMTTDDASHFAQLPQQNKFSIPYHFQKPQTPLLQIQQQQVAHLHFQQQQHHQQQHQQHLEQEQEHQNLQQVLQDQEPEQIQHEGQVKFLPINSNLPQGQSALPDSPHLSRRESTQGGSTVSTTSSPLFKVASPFAFDASPSSRCLPGAISSEFTFKKLDKVRINHINLLLSNIMKAGPKIVKGTCPLYEIRALYLSWINSFIYRSYDSKLMFSCLLNFGVNYLISTCLEPEQATLSFPAVNRKKLKNLFIVISIRHYGNIIKLLREVLNLSKNPELCSLTSYILSLMSIYDPEATLHSINCFRDGLFGVLSHYLNIAKMNSLKPTILIPSHLQLMKNIARSVYLPGYDPTFLQEYSQVLENFGEVLKWYISHCPTPISETMRFVHSKHSDLVNFNDDTINYYLPRLNGNLSDIDVQQEVLFEMVHRWVRLFPSKMLVITKKSHPLEKIIYLFYKTMKKALYAICPQVKFFFLRDFDLPLMTEVFVIKVDYDIFRNELDHPINIGEIPSELYPYHVEDLKQTAAYLLRINAFLEGRLAILYRYIVYEEAVTSRFPIDDIRKWRSSIKSIETARQDFNDIVGFNSEPITNFRDTIIQPKHYPTATGTPIEEFEAVTEVDFNTLQEDSFLTGDYNPKRA